MEKLLEKIKTKEDFDMFTEILIERMKNKQPISDNPMFDGMVIGFILTTNFAVDLFLRKDMGHVLDGTIQKLKTIYSWCYDNEAELLNIMKTTPKFE